MTKARDIADFKFENITDTGTEGTKVASGTTAQRGSTQGQFRFNSTTNKFEGSNGSTFISIEGTPVISSVANTNITQAQIDAGLAPSGADTNTVATRGLKYNKKELIDNQCAGILAPSDWMVVKATETGTTMDSGWKTWRASVRTKCNSMQTQIDNAANVDALAALFKYTTTDGVTSRPLGEFPVKE